MSKWKLHQAISKGHKAINLVTTYQEKIIDRLVPGEFDTLKTNVVLLDTKGAGQSETLNVQKTETQNVNSRIKKAYESVSVIRKLIAKTTSDKEIRTAFGLGTKISHNSVSDIKAAVNIIDEGYKRFTGWSNSAGILERDITELQALLVGIATADETQESSKTVRVVATVNKDLIQTKVEDTITKISGIGVLAFYNTNPELVPLFEALIPGSGGSDDDDSSDDTTPEQSPENELTGA